MTFLRLVALLCTLLLLTARFKPLHAQAQLPPIYKYLKEIEITELYSWIHPVDCIYVINLDERKDRWEWIKTICEELFLFPNRVSAVNGWKLSEEAQQELSFPYPCRLRGGQFGCLLSHISVLKDAAQRNFSVIWVMEDDIEFVEDPRQLSDILAELSDLDPDWDLFYTDCDYRDCCNGYLRSLSNDFRPDQKKRPAQYYTERIHINNNIMRIRSRFGTYSMLISKKGIQKILAYFTSRPIWTAIDIDLHYISDIREYAPRKDIVSNLCNSVSDTEEDRL